MNNKEIWKSYPHEMRGVGTSLEGLVRLSRDLGMLNEEFERHFMVPITLLYERTAFVEALMQTKWEGRNEQMPLVEKELLETEKHLMVALFKIRQLMQVDNIHTYENNKQDEIQKGDTQAV